MTLIARCQKKKPSNNYFAFDFQSKFHGNFYCARTRICNFWKVELSALWNWKVSFVTYFSHQWDRQMITTKIQIFFHEISDWSSSSSLNGRVGALNIRNQSINCNSHCVNFSNYFVSFFGFHFSKLFFSCFSFDSAAADSSISKLHEYDDDDHYHHHQHSYDEQFAFDSAEALLGSSELPQKRLDRPYRPRAGEILVKDSTYYQQSVAPQDRPWLHRRNYWPLIDNTVTSLAAKAVAGANDVKNLLKVNFYNQIDNVNAAVQYKKQKLKTILLSAAQDAAHHHPVLRGHHPWLGKHPLLPQKQRLVQNIKPPVIIHSKTKPLPSTTISEDYIHTYDNSYVPPAYVTMGRPEKNPYASMGVTSYKHFEDTILKELEEKEERKVEATMHTLFDDKFILQETLLGTKPATEVDDADHDEWTPLNNSGGNIIPQQSTLFNSAKPPYPVSELQTSSTRPLNDIRPVCEQQNDVSLSPTLFHPLGASSYHEQQTSSSENAIKVLPHESKKTTKSRFSSNKTAAAFKLRATSTTERPNYPAYFLKQQQQMKKLQQKLLNSHRSTSHGQKVLQRQKFGQQIHATAPTTASSLLFYPFNSTDDGFRPIIPSDIASMRNIKPSRNTATDTTLIVDAITVTPSPIKAATSTVRTTIQAQPSNVRVSIVAAPVKPIATTTAAPKSTIDTGFIRKTNTKKFTPTEKPNNRNTTATYKATQKHSRGSIKFTGSSLQVKR